MVQWNIFHIFVAFQGGCKMCTGQVVGKRPGHIHPKGSNTVYVVHPHADAEVTQPGPAKIKK